MFRNNRPDCSAARDVLGQHEEGARAWDDAECEALAETVPDVVLGFGCLATGPLAIGFVLFVCQESPDDRSVTVFYERARCSFRELIDLIIPFFEKGCQLDAET